MYEALPKNERSFDVDIKGETTGLSYRGTFTVKCILNMGEQHAEELEKTRLMADYVNPTDRLFGISASLATIRTRIIDAPEWWKQNNSGANLMDANIIRHLYDKCMDMEDAWKKDLKAVTAPKQPEQSVAAPAAEAPVSPTAPAEGN